MQTLLLVLAWEVVAFFTLLLLYGIASCYFAIVELWRESKENDKLSQRDS